MAYVSFEPLKAWIAQQENYERRFGRPAPLTDNERLAMAVLVPPPPTPPPELPVRPDVDLKSVDCVSLLMRYTSSKKPPYDPPVYVDEPVEGKLVLWRCRCTLPQEAPGSVFPGLDEDLKLSEFSRKKDAKQYAARRAVEWLMAHGRMPTDGVSVVFPASPSRPPGLGSNGSVSRSGSSSTSSSGFFARSRDAAVQKSASLTPSLSSASSPSPRTTPIVKPPTPNGVPRNNTAPEALPLPRQLPPSTQEVARPATAPPARNVASMASWRAAAPLAAAAEAPPTGSAAAADLAAGEKRPVDPPTASVTNSKRIRGSPRSSGGGSGGDNDDEVMSNVEQLAKLCEMFHLGQPKYVLESGQGESVYSGSVSLISSAKHAKNVGPSPGGDGVGGRVIPLPPGVGVVRDIYLKRPAKEKMAQSVLQFLRTSVLQLSGEAESDVY